MPDLGTPACLLGDPADLGLTDSTHDPVTSVLLDNDHFTRRTFHRVAKLQEFLHKPHIKCTDKQPHHSTRGPRLENARSTKNCFTAAMDHRIDRADVYRRIRSDPICHWIGPIFSPNRPGRSKVRRKTGTFSTPDIFRPLVSVANLPSRRTLCPGICQAFNSRWPTRHSWLLELVSATSPSLSTFCQWLKTWLFRESFPDIII